MDKRFIRLIIVLTVCVFLSSNVNSKILTENNNSIAKFDTSSADVLKDYNNLRIKYPLSTIPTFVEQNSNFTVELECNNFEKIYAYISTSYEPVIDQIWLNLENTYKVGEKHYATFKVPNDAPVELYNLTVIVLINDIFYIDNQPRSVSIIDSFSDSFNFIHVTDLHVGDVRGFFANIRETIGFKSIKRCIKEINLLHPDFVIISGDLVFGQLFRFEYLWEYKKCYEVIQTFDVPTFLVPGNHDGYRRIGEDGLELWKKYFGPLHYSFNYGDYHFQAINSFDWPDYLRTAIGPITLNWGGCIEEEQLEWIEEDLTEFNSSKLKFQFMHHSPLWDTKSDSLLRMEYKNRENLCNLIDDFNVDMVLAGHIHRDNVTIKNGTIFLTTTTPESDIRKKDGYWGYRLITIKNKTIDSYNYKEPPHSIPSYELDVDYESDYKAVVTNGLETEVEVLLKFTVPKRPYSIQGGNVIITRDNEYQIEYYISANVAAETTKTINLIYIS